MPSVQAICNAAAILLLVLLWAIPLCLFIPLVSPIILLEFYLLNKYRRFDSEAPDRIRSFNPLFSNFHNRNSGASNDDCIEASEFDLKLFRIVYNADIFLNRILDSYFNIFALVFDKLIGVEIFAKGAENLTDFGAIPIVISNHVSYYDWIHIALLFRSLKAQGSCLFLATSDVQNIPMFGIYSFLKHQCYLERKYEKDRATLNRYFNFIDPYNINSLVIFVEGNVMFEKTWKYRNKILSEKNLPIFHNLMYPKSRGLKLLLENFDFLDPANHNRPIIFLTLQNPSNYPFMPQDLLTTKKYKVFIDIEVNRKEEIFGKSPVQSNANSSQVEDGLNCKWHIMDKNIGEFKNSFEEKEKEYVKIINCKRSHFVSTALHFANFLMIIKLCSLLRPLSIILYLLLCIFCQTFIINLYKYL